ncbi:hypothetical protein ATANTOWER_025286 [Ataeniobius toweri]|uniref:Uncharacterized protein n=1 Tax=Ataeniobius toweri TaxID=208326 RepID=A0ABU7AZJ0_9TELE|nr:hypothetical protein [Ataeniobius toweri]
MTKLLAILADAATDSPVRASCSRRGSSSSKNVAGASPLTAAFLFFPAFLFHSTPLKVHRIRSCHSRKQKASIRTPGLAVLPSPQQKCLNPQPGASPLPPLSLHLSVILGVTLS